MRMPNHMNKKLFLIPLALTSCGAATSQPMPIAFIWLMGILLGIVVMFGIGILVIAIVNWLGDRKDAKIKKSQSLSDIDPLS